MVCMTSRGRISVLMMTVLLGSMISPKVVFAKENFSDAIYEIGLEYIDTYLGIEEADEIVENPEETEDSEETVNEEVEDMDLLHKNYPEKFSLTNVFGKNYVSPVKMQNPWGTCWVFAAIAAAETSIMYELDMPVTEENKDPLNLSEKQLAWFSYIPIPAGEENHQDGEGVWCVDKMTGQISRNPDIIYDQGGFLFSATQIFSSGIGPLLESILPYGPAEQELPNAADYTEQDEEGNSYYWTKNGDWTVPESMRDIYSYTLEETRTLPPSAENNLEGVLAMKGELLEGRPVWITYYADDYEPGTSNDSEDALYLCRNEQGMYSQYTYEQEALNHAVTVVGYDDHYAKENFLEGHRPEGDGAWLVKNSWGTSKEFGVFPDISEEGWGNNGDGFFWLSYYDKSIGYEQTLNFDLSKEELESESKIICQYDYMPSGDNIAVRMPAMSAYANVFTTHEEEKLSDVGIFSLEPNSKLSISVYQLKDNAKNPKNGKKIDYLEVTFPYAGYHKIKLPKEHSLKAGQKYAVIVTEETEDGESIIPVHVAPDFSLVELLNTQQGEEAYESSFSVGVVNPGESYLYIDGRWNDYADIIKEGKEAIELETGIQGGVLAIDNFTIKTYGREIK